MLVRPRLTGWGLCAEGRLEVAGRAHVEGLPVDVGRGGRYRGLQPRLVLVAGPMEISWFAALCDDDYEVLGTPDPALVSTVEHCASIVVEAERQGFDSILLPSGYALGIDAVTFAAAVAHRTERIRLLVAVRCGEAWPPQLARQLATLDEALGGRLAVNIISSDLPGETLGSKERYRRTLEVMEVLGSLLGGRTVEHHGAHYDLAVGPPRITRERPRRLPLYFGGLSEPARQVAARAADVYLMWPDTEERVAATVEDLRRRATDEGRTLRFGYRVHVVVRDTEDEARAAADRLVADLAPEVGDAIRSRSLDATSAGVARQGELRLESDEDGYVEPHLWTGIGRARSGCGAALVGAPEQVAAKIHRYQELGIDALILSGYPHRDECRRFGRTVLPLLDHGLLDVGA